MKLFIVFGIYAGLFVNLLPSKVLAKAPLWRDAIVVVDDSELFAEPDFESEIKGYLPAGTRVKARLKKDEMFHRVILREKKFAGFVADYQLRFDRLSEWESAIAKERNDEYIPEPEPPGKNTSWEDELGLDEQLPEGVEWQRFRGVALQHIWLREKTLGQNPTSPIQVFGLKFSGFGVVSDKGENEFNLGFAGKAPKHYEELTGESARGYQLWLSYLSQFSWGLTPSFATFFGIGPEMRWQDYQLQLRQASGGTKSYQAQDLHLGALLQAGVVQKLGPALVRVEAQWHWAELHFFGLGFALQWQY